TERRTVITRAIWNFYYLGCFERRKVNSRYSRGIVTIYKHPFSVGITACHRELRMMSVIPRNESVRSFKHRLAFFRVTPSVFGMLCKYRYYLQKSSTW